MGCDKQYLTRFFLIRRTTLQFRINSKRFNVNSFSYFFIRIVGIFGILIWKYRCCWSVTVLFDVSRVEYKWKYIGYYDPYRKMVELFFLNHCSCVVSQLNCQKFRNTFLLDWHKWLFIANKGQSVTNWEYAIGSRSISSRNSNSNWTWKIMAKQPI